MFTDSNVYPISVSGNIVDAVRAGRYDLFNDSVNDQFFTADQPHDCDLILKHFSKNMRVDPVLAILDAEGLRPATMSELLALGAQHSDLQRRFHIAALGSVWHNLRGYSNVGYLSGNAGFRALHLYGYDIRWDASDCFAAVRKVA